MRKIQLARSHIDDFKFTHPYTPRISTAKWCRKTSAAAKQCTCWEGDHQRRHEQQQRIELSWHTGGSPNSPTDFCVVAQFSGEVPQSQSLLGKGSYLSKILASYCRTTPTPLAIYLRAQIPATLSVTLFVTFTPNGGGGFTVCFYYCAPEEVIGARSLANKIYSSAVLGNHTPRS